MCIWTIVEEPPKWCSRRTVTTPSDAQPIWFNAKTQECVPLGFGVPRISWATVVVYQRVFRVRPDMNNFSAHQAFTLQCLRYYKVLSFEWWWSACKVCILIFILSLLFWILELFLKKLIFRRVKSYSSIQKTQIILIFIF